ncbi:MAG: hypothetical protein IPH58_10095 [Sphingobacteriales bacterium]|jgi:hypothetical protein|nr:hypothetical protein [Sphingobacteriales bacterium]
MRPNNIQERNKSFQRFLLFFILTVAIIMVTVFFGIRVPYAENEKLREQIAQMDKENQFRENFSVSMTETQSLLDTVNLDVARAGLIDGRITQKVQDMDALINKTDLSSKTLYSQVVKALNNSQSDKRGLRAASSKDSLVAMYNAQIQALQNSLTKWQESYNQLKMQNDILRQMK